MSGCFYKVLPATDFDSWPVVLELPCFFSVDMRAMSNEMSHQHPKKVQYADILSTCPRG